MKRIGSLFSFAALSCLIFLSLVCAGSAFAVNDVSLSVNAEKKSVMVGEEFSITYSATVYDAKKFSLNRAPNFPDFVVVSESKRFRDKLIGGKVYTTFVYSYVIKAKKAGRLKTGRAAFAYGKVTYTTAPVEIEVKQPPVEKPKPPVEKPKPPVEKPKPPVKKPKPPVEKPKPPVEKPKPPVEKPKPPVEKPKPPVEKPKPPVKKPKPPVEKPKPPVKKPKPPVEKPKPPVEKPKPPVKKPKPPVEKPKPPVEKPKPPKVENVKQKIGKKPESKEAKPKKKGKKKGKVGYPKKRGALFVRASVNKSNPFAGEGIIYTFRLYHPLDYFGSPAFTPPGFTGFFVEELPQSRSSKKIAELGGKYIIEELNYAIFPLVTGKISIPTGTLEYKGTDGRLHVLRSDNVKVAVKRLPKYKPDFDVPYSGSVGSFNIQLKVKEKKPVQHEPFNITITIRGKGNITGIDEPYFVKDDDFSYTLLDTKENIITQAAGLSGGKDFIYSVIIKKAGKVSFNKINYVYFDPVKEKYVKVSTKKETIVVSPGKKAEWKRGDDFKGLNSILAPIRVGEKIKKGYSFYKSGLFFYIMLILLFSSLTALSFSFRKVYEVNNKEVITKKKAMKAALAGIEDARSHLHNQKIEDFYIKIQNLLNQFFIDRYDLDIISHPLDLLEELITANQREKELISGLTEKIRLLNYFRYSSKTKISEEELREFLTELKKNIKGIQKCNG
jgi:hypothetical protein